MDDAPIQSYLEPGETLLWSGSPQRKFRFGPQHAPLFFMLIAFASFIVLPVIGLLNKEHSTQANSPAVSNPPTHSTDEPSSPPEHKQTRSQRAGEALFFILFFGSFAGMIFYAIYAQIGGRFLSSRTSIYALTDQRVVIVTGNSKKQVTSLMLTTLSQVQMQQWPDGLGTITFGPRPVWPAINGLYATTPSLENISDSGKVFHLIAKGRGAT